MAYQFWKSGLLGRDFHYRRSPTRMDGGVLWATTSRAEQAEATHPPFGARGRHLQRHRRAAVVPAEAPEAGAHRGRPPGGGRAAHALLVRDGGAVARHRARAGLRAGSRPEDAKRPFVEVSGRKGLGVKADDLIDRVIEKALAGGGAAATRSCPTGAARRSRERHRRCRRALLHVKYSADQGHRLRHRRGAQLRRRERAVSAVRRRPGEQHLPEAAGARGPERGRRARGPAPRRRPTP